MYISILVGALFTKCILNKVAENKYLHKQQKCIQYQIIEYKAFTCWIAATNVNCFIINEIIKQSFSHNLLNLLEVNCQITCCDLNFLKKYLQMFHMEVMLS